MGLGVLNGDFEFGSVSEIVDGWVALGDLGYLGLQGIIAYVDTYSPLYR